MTRSASGLAALALVVALAGCGGSSTEPPAGLAYATNPATYTRGTAIAANAPTSTGGAVETYAVTPALPAGLALHPATGVLSGTPTAITPQATYTVTAANSGGSTTASLTLTVNDAAPAGLAYATNPATYTKGAAIAANAPTSTGGAVVGYAVTPALPAGLALHPTTGVLSGTPTAITPQAAYTVTATNTGGSTTASLSVTVNDVPPSSLVYANAIATYTVGIAIAPNVPTIGGGAVLGYTVSPALPPGLTLDPTTGVVTGTPTAVAPSALHLVTATNSGGSTDGALILAVVEPVLVSLAVTPASGDVTAGGATLPLTARATYSNATTTDVTGLATWTTAAPGQVDVTTSGLASSPPAARVGGSGTVTATLGGQQASATLRVVRGPPVGPTLRERPHGPGAVVPLEHRPDGLLRLRGHPRSRPPALRRAGAGSTGVRREGRRWWTAASRSPTRISRPTSCPDRGTSWTTRATRAPPPTPPRATTAPACPGSSGCATTTPSAGWASPPLVGLNGYNYLQFQTLASMTMSIGGSASNPTSNDVWIFNQSFGTSAAYPVPAPPAIEAQYLAGVTTLRSGKGALYVKSAGNGFRGFGTASLRPGPGDRGLLRERQHGREERASLQRRRRGSECTGREEHLLLGRVGDLGGGPGRGIRLQRLGGRSRIPGLRLRAGHGDDRPHRLRERLRRHGGGDERFRRGASPNARATTRTTSTGRPRRLRPRRAPSRCSSTRGPTSPGAT